VQPSTAEIRPIDHRSERTAPTVDFLKSAGRHEMNWKLKANLLFLFDRIPCGALAYRSLRPFLAPKPPQPEECIRRAADLIDAIRQTGRDPTQGTYLELGTGWRPYFPILLVLLGAQKVVTVDVDIMVKRQRVNEIAEEISTRSDLVASLIGIDENLLNRNLADFKKNMRLRQDIFGCGSITYQIIPRSGCLNLDDQAVDFVVSSNVLEHLPKDALSTFHRESARILGCDGVAVHRANPGDHFALVDSSISSVNFLRFSKSQWRRYGEDRWAFQNRLRYSDHVELFKENGFEVIACRGRVDPKALRVLEVEELQIHADFRGYQVQDLATDYIWLAGTPRKQLLHRVP
jgi:Methyltransferase domain